MTLHKSVGGALAAKSSGAVKASIAESASVAGRVAAKAPPTNSLSPAHHCPQVHP